MIREYKKSDIPQLLELFQINNPLTPEELKDKEEELSGDCCINVYVKNDNIAGLCSMEFWNNPDLGSSAEIIMSVYEPISDINEFNEIAENLWSSAQEKLQEKKVYQLLTSYEDHKDHWHTFFENKGFDKWFKVHGMVYKGDGELKESLTYRNYTDEDFDMYYTTLGQCFYPMRSSIDIRPHNVYDNKDPKRLKNMRKQTLKEKDRTYMFYDGNTFVGSSIIKEEELDDVFVVTELQGKGYGKRIMESTIKLQLQNNPEKITLGVLDWNVPAFNLYKKSGFEVYRTVQNRRKFMYEK